MVTNEDQRALADDGLKSAHLLPETTVFFIGLAVLFLLLKFADVGFVSNINVWWVIAPLACAAVWWALADKYGYTQRKAMERLDERKAMRRQRQIDALRRGPGNR